MSDNHIKFEAFKFMKERNLEKEGDLEKDIEFEAFKFMKEGNLEKVEEIFSQYNLDYLRITEDKWNWLHEILMGFDPNSPPRKTIEFLIQKGVPINAQDIYGMTPLHYAMRSRNPNAVMTLLEAGANPNIPNRDMVTPLTTIGYMPKELNVLKMMLEKGGDIHFFNGQNRIFEGIKKHLSNHPDFVDVIKIMEEHDKKLKEKQAESKNVIDEK